MANLCADCGARMELDLPDGGYPVEICRRCKEQPTFELEPETDADDENLPF